MKTIILLTFFLTISVNASTNTNEPKSCLNLEAHDYSDMPDTICVKFFDRKNARVELYRDDLELDSTNFTINKWKHIYFGLGGRRTSYYRGSTSWVEIEIENLTLHLSLESNLSDGEFNSSVVSKAKIFNSTTNRVIKEYKAPYRKRPASYGGPRPGGHSKV